MFLNSAQVSKVKRVPKEFVILIDVFGLNNVCKFLPGNNLSFLFFGIALIFNIRTP